MPDEAREPVVAFDSEQQHHRAVLDSLGEGVVVQDTEGRVLFLNTQAEAILGLVGADAIGRTAHELGWAPFEESDRPRRAQDRPGLAGVLGQQVEGVVVQQEQLVGSRRWLELSSYPLVEAAAPEAVVTVIRDVSARVAAETRHRQLSELVQSSNDAIIGEDLYGVIVTWNSGAEHLLGHAATDILGHSVSEIVPSDQLHELPSLSTLLDAGEDPGTIDTWWRRKDGSLVEVSLRHSSIVDDHGRVVGRSSIARDVTERSRRERDHEADLRRLEEAQRLGRLGSYELDLDTGELVWSGGLYRLLRVNPETTPTVDLYRSLGHPEDAVALELALERAIEDRLPTEIEHRLLLPDATVLWVRAQATPIDAGTKLAGVVQDITEQREADVASIHRALHDPLTGLANRTLLEDRLVKAAAEHAPAEAMAVVLAIGIDQIALVNAELGRDAGDDLLVQVAQRLTAVAPTTDTVARLAADEFVIVCDQIAWSPGPGQLARAVESAMAEPFVIQGREVFISVSIGAVETDLGSDPVHAVRLATDAMAQAERRGGGQFFLAGPTVASRAPTHRLDVASALRHAIDRDELRLHYQPVIDLDAMRLCGFEALVRWQHPERGLLYPGEFISIAEDTGLILGIGGWVLGEAIRQIAHWRNEGAAPELSIAVNISARQLRTADLLVDLCDHLDHHGVPAQAVHLEITESVLMDDVEHSIESLVALKSTGVQVDVDDFGTGYSSLSYLKRLPIDGLKIDQSFVAGLGRDENDSAITHAIVSLGRALHLDVIAEGVETEAQARQIRALGCQSGQGHLWSAAVPAPEASQLITSLRLAD